MSETFARATRPVPAARAARCGMLAAIAIIFIYSSAAFATTFGPISVYQQARESQYYVHGRVVSGPSVKMEQRLGRPYTYWTVQVTEQPSGEALGAQVSIRQPGGEIGDMGYHMAGTADFIVGEDVFVALRDTDDPGEKEVVGLASGKYRVEAQGGRAVVMSGLGLPVSGNDGRTLSPDEFSELLRRIARGEATEADKDVWVSRRLSHEKDENPALEAQARKILGAPERKPADAGTAVATDSSLRQVPAKSPAPKENSVQESPPLADETSTGFSSWGWLEALAVVAGLAIALYLALKR